MFTNRQFVQVLLPYSPFSGFRCTNCGWSTWGLSSILVFWKGSKYHYSSVLLRLSVLWRYPIGSLFSLYCTTRNTPFWTSSLSPARTAVDSGILHYTEIDSIVCNCFSACVFYICYTGHHRIRTFVIIPRTLVTYLGHSLPVSDTRHLSRTHSFIILER